MSDFIGGIGGPGPESQQKSTLKPLAHLRIRRDKKHLRFASRPVAGSAGLCPTTSSVFPNTTLPHLKSLLIPRSHSTSTHPVSSTTRTSVTSNTPALTRSLMRAIWGSASKAFLIFSCLLAFFASVTAWGCDERREGLHEWGENTYRIVLRTEHTDLEFLDHLRFLLALGRVLSPQARINRARVGPCLPVCLWP